jgi:uncharacterized protein YcsI (UPF0317 family)
MTPPHACLVPFSTARVRAAIRAGSCAGYTAGLAAGKLQCCLAILPHRFARDFLRFCQRNPKPCPVVGVSDSGDPNLRTLCRDVDIRTDVSKYRVFRNGALSEDVTDITGHWADDLFTVALLGLLTLSIPVGIVVFLPGFGTEAFFSSFPLKRGLGNMV